VTAAVGILAASALAGCNTKADTGSTSAAPEKGAANGGATATSTDKPAPPARLRVNVARAGVPVDTLVKVTAQNATLKQVSVTARGGGGALPGGLADDDSAWSAADRLEPGTAYHVSALAVDEAGATQRLQRTFHTVPLTLDQQTFPSIAPVQGETVGVGMPVIVNFDVPVTDRASIEKHLSVETSPKQQGTWHWISDNEVHWRPRTYWKAGTDVTVHADINGVSAGNGIYGQENRATSFHIGDAVMMKINVKRHEMSVLDNGRLMRTIPVTAGQPGLETRSGIKVIIEKFRYKDMDAATTGVSPNDPNYYNISNVEYAQRVTYSGEFLHAAPWSLGSQGHANVSHGCVGMSTANAAWLYSLTKRGDVVDVTGTDRAMEPDNGYGDWNVPWQQYESGSALS